MQELFTEQQQQHIVPIPPLLSIDFCFIPHLLQEVSFSSNA